MSSRASMTSFRLHEAPRNAPRSPEGTAARSRYEGPHGPVYVGHLVALRRRPAPFPARPVIVARRLLDAAMAEVESGGPARAVTSLRAKAHLQADTAAAW